MRKVFMSKTKALMAVLALVAMTGCSDMSKKEQRVLSGAAIGAGAGTAGAAMTGGCVGCGAAIGTAVGAGAGYIFDETKKD